MLLYAVKASRKTPLLSTRCILPWVLHWCITLLINSFNCTFIMFTHVTDWHNQRLTFGIYYRYKIKQCCQIVIASFNDSINSTLKIHYLHIINILYEQVWHCYASGGFAMCFTPWKRESHDLSKRLVAVNTPDFWVPSTPMGFYECESIPHFAASPLFCLGINSPSCAFQCCYQERIHKNCCWSQLHGGCPRAPARHLWKV